MADWINYEAPNAGLLFYKQLYKENDILTQPNGATRLEEKTETENDEHWTELTIFVDKRGASPFNKFYDALYTKPANQFGQIQRPINCEHFSLATSYPGLLIGSGYNHNTKARGDAVIGFFFDHTTGQSVIPGSSVKGVCRSVFELDLNNKGKNVTGHRSLEFLQYLLDETEEANPKLTEEIDQFKKTISDKKKLKEIKEAIFGSQTSMGKDIFFDAVLNIEKTGNNTIFYSDFITPHKDSLKNPIPTQFLKVGPEVFFEFRFKLTDTSECRPELKKALFRQILLILGIGAKTNVGYGQFTEPPKQAVFKQGDVIEGKIVDSEFDNHAFIFQIPRSKNFRKQVKMNIFNRYMEGDVVNLEVLKVREDGSIRSLKIID